MATLTTDIRTIGNKKYKFPIKCSSTGKFSTNYDVDFNAINRKNEFDTQTELLKEISRVCDALSDLKTETNFLICYTVAHKKTFGLAMFGEKPKVSAIELSYAVIRERKIGSDARMDLLNEGVIGGQHDGEMLDGFYREGSVTSNVVDRFEHKVPFDAVLYNNLKTLSKAIEDLAAKMNQTLTPDFVKSLTASDVKLIN
jgi:hypothetical protein